MNGRKSDTAILSQKSVKADGEKGCALYSLALICYLRSRATINVKKSV
jgi:hypothetical protein